MVQYTFTPCKCVDDASHFELLNYFRFSNPNLGVDLAENNNKIHGFYKAILVFILHVGRSYKNLPLSLAPSLVRFLNPL